MARSVVPRVAASVALLPVIAIAIAPGALAAPSVTVSATTWTVGSPATVIGGGFPASQTFSISFDQQPVDVASSSRTSSAGPQTDPTGAFQASITLPAAGYGAHQVCAQVSSEIACAPV